MLSKKIKLFSYIIFLLATNQYLFSQNIIKQASLLSKESVTSMQGYIDAESNTVKKNELIKIQNFVRNKWDENNKPFDISVLYEIKGDTVRGEGDVPGSPVSLTTKVVDALSMIIADRIKQDLSSIFLEDLKKILEKNNKFFGGMLPETYKYIVQIVKDPFVNQISFTILKSTIEDDLRNILINLNGVIISQVKTTDFNHSVMISVLTILNNLIDGNSPMIAIKKIDIKGTTAEEMRFAEMIQISKILYVNLFGENGKLKVENVNELNSTDIISYFFALLYLNSQNSSGLKVTLLREVGMKIESDYSLFTNLKTELNNFVESIANLQRQLKVTEDIKDDEKSSESEKIVQYTKYIKESIEIFKKGINIIKVCYKINNSTFDDKPYIEITNKIEFFSNSAIQIYKGINNKKYGIILSNVIIVLDSLNVINTDDIKEVTKYLSFGIDFVNAENSESMKNTLNNFIEKPGSYTRKRSNFTISISSYPGFYGGTEQLSNSTDEEKVGSFGFTVPIGIELGYKKVGIFFSAFDIGAAVNYRLKDTNSTSLPNELTLKQIFSPGISFRFTFWKDNPIGFGIGYQYTPELRKVTKNGSEFQSNSHRLMFSIAYDLPLLFIY